MILSISKKYFLASTFVLASFLASCSHQKQQRSIFPPRTLKDEAPKYLTGPEVPSSIFVDKTEEYGLKDVQAVHLYAVDVDHDGYTDLVTLDDFYAAPKFYFFNPKIHKFVLGANFFWNISVGE